VNNARNTSQGDVPVPKRNPLLFRLVVIACLALTAVCLELFVFPLVPPTQEESPIKNGAITEQGSYVSKLDAGTDEALNSEITYDYKYEYYQHTDLIVHVNGEEVDLNQLDPAYVDPDKYALLELEGLDDEPALTIWF